MDIAAYLSLIIVLSFLLVKAAGFVEEAFVIIARKLGISPFFIGFFILAAMSSLPEASVAISSAINQAPQLSVGNLLGASFTIITFVVGLNVVFRTKLPFKGKFSFPQLMLAMLILFLQIFVMIDGDLRFEEGILLIASYLLFSIYIAEHAQTRNKTHPESTIQVGTLWNLMLKAVVGLVGLLIISNFTVDAAIRLSEILDIPKSLIGVLVLSFGTNLPELALLFTSKTKDAKKLAIGNFLGSATLNTGILGFLIVLQPHQLTSLPVLLAPMILMGVALAMFTIFAFTGKEITKREGFFLIGIYAIFVSVQVIEVLSV